MAWEGWVTDGTERLDFLPENGLVIQDVNLGWPSVRRVRQERPNQSGIVDTTMYFAERPITVRMGLAHELAGEVSDQYAMDRIRGWMRPDLRYWLYLCDGPDDCLRRYAVRPNTTRQTYRASRPSRFTLPTFQWINYDGIGEFPDRQSKRITPSTLNELGFNFDVNFDLTFPPSDPIGNQIIKNEGNAPAWFTLRIFGPATGAGVLNNVTGQRVKMKDSFDILAGQYIEIDMKEGSVLLDGNPANSRYSELDFDVTEWWQLQQGDNLLSFTAVTQADPAGAELIYYHTYL